MLIQILPMNKKFDSSNIVDVDHDDHFHQPGHQGGTERKHCHRRQGSQSNPASAKILSI